MTRIMISVIVPVFGNSDTLMELERRLGETLAGTGASFEIIFVDDHSPDGSWTVIEEIAAAGGGRTRGLRLAQNVGQHMAILTGLSEARGTRCVVLDADLQYPPKRFRTSSDPSFTITARYSPAGAETMPLQAAYSPRLCIVGYLVAYRECLSMRACSSRLHKRM
jgi:glycosyltransferase involved in cell wall biosynthesis